MAFSENDIARRRTELQHAPNSDHFKYQKPDVTAPARHGSIDSPTRSTGGSTTGKASGEYTEERIARRRSDLQHGGSDKFAYQRPDFSGFSAPKPASSPIYSPDGAFFPKRNPYEGVTTRRPNPLENIPYSDPLTRAFSQQTGWRDPKAQALYDLAERMQNPQRNTPIPTFRSGPLADADSGPRSRSVEAERQASEAARDALDQAAAGVRFNRTEAEKRRRSNAISFPKTETADDEYSGKMEQRPEWLGGQSVGEYMRDFMNSQEALGTYGADVVREYNRIYDSQGAGAAQKYVMSKDSTGNPGMERIDAFLTGVGNASGINSIAGIAMGPENYRRVASEQQSISEAHPIASAAGAITGTLPLITTLGRFARAIPAVAGLSKAAQAVISGAAAMGGSTAIQEAGAVANGLISPWKYAGDVAVSGLAGIAGGALGNTVSQKGMQFLYDSGLINNSIARTVVAGLSGSGYSVGSTGVREASAFIRDPENYEADPVRIIKDASVAFAFGAISYIANGGTRFTMNEEASNERPKSKWFEDCSTPQEVDAKLRQYARQYHPDQSTGDADLFSEISAEATAQKAWMNVNAGAQAYQKAQKAYSDGNADAYQEAKAEYEAAVNALVVDVQSGAIQGQEAVEAIQVLQSVSANLAGPEAQAPATSGSEALAALADQSFPSTAPSTAPSTVAQPSTTGAEIFPQAQDVPGNPYSSMTADQRLAMVAREMMAPANRPESEANAGVGVEAPSTVSSTSNTLPSTASSAGKAISMAQHSANAPSRAITLEDIARSVVEQKVDTKDAQRQVIVDVAQNLDHENLAAAMENATMLTEAEKQAAFREGVGNAAIEMGEENRNVAGEPGGYLSGEGSGRPVSLGAGEPVGEVSSEAGRAPQGWKDWTAAADAGIKGDAGESVALKSGVAAEKILRTAEPGQVIYEVESGHTPSMRKAAAMVSAYDSNIEIVPFVSEHDILVSEGESVRAFADPMTRRIGYRANDERATGEQLGKHELIEFGIIDGKIDVPEALSYLTSEFKSLGIGELVDRIATAYMNGEASPSLEALRYANKEMLCDIGAGINQFEGVKGYEVLSDAVELAHDRLHDYMNEKLGGAFEAEYDETTAPAAIAETAAGTGTEATAPSRIVGESPKVEITDKNVSVDSIVPTITEMPKNLPEYSSTLYREPAQKELFTLSKDGKISIKEKLNMSGRDFLIKQMKEKGYRDKKNTLAWLDKTADFMDKAEAVYTYIGLDDIKNTKIVIDPRSGNIVLRALVKNGEYPVNIDLTKECTRRIALGKFVDWLSRNAGRKGGKTMLEEVPLTASNLVLFNKILKDEGFDTACLGCFVETRRYRIQEWADSFIEKYNKAVEKSNPGAGYFNFADKDVYVSDLSKKDLADLNEALESYKASVKEERSAKKAFAKAEKERLKSIGATKKQIDSVKSDLTNEEQINALVRSNKIYQKKLRVSDLITPGGRTVLHRDFPELESLVLGHYGSNTPKSVELFTPYNYDLGSILSVGSQTLRDYVKPIGGAREQSFSDSVPTHLMDQMEKTADMAVNKLPDHIYTKIPSEVLLFGLTKRKFNMSIMFNIDPNVDSAHAGLRADGSYFVGDRKTSELEARAGRERTFVQSFPYDMARKIQHMPGYSENCGMIGVGYSYFHIRKMLADPEFGYIIGYHPSGMNGELASASHIDKATSYEPVQNTLKINGLRHVTGELDGLPSYASWPQGIKTTDNKMIEKTKLTMKDFDMKGNLKKYGGKETMRRFLAWLEENRLTVDTSKASYKGVEQHGVGSFPLYEDLARTKDYRKTADNYIAWCLENDMLPEFFEFADDDNYFNFIYDFTTYDHNTGKYSPQVPVQMNFPGNFFRLAAHSLNQWNNYMMRQDPKEIPTFEKMYNEAAQQLHYSSKLDLSGNKDSDGNNLTVGQEEYFKDSKVRDSNGNLKVMYHGTGRADRVGTVFDPNRATSGPMAYFTDDKTIAENYARDKQDTSLTKEGAGDYHRMYRMNIGGNTYTIEDAWDKLPTRKRVEIRKKAPHITLDDDGEEIIFSNDTNRGLGNFDNYLINSNGGNYIKALIESWLDDGTLYGEEERFKEVLSLVGLDDVEYLDPEYRDEKVYAVYLNVTNPLNTSDIHQDVIDNLRDASENATWTGPDSNVDNWDKTNISPQEWFRDFEKDLKDGTAYVWTRIPDWVTDTLKDMGYDGISDMGGKGGGATHNVVIPFSSNQIKNIDNANPTENEDIRYSSKLDLSGAKDSSGKTLTAQQAEYFKDSKARDAEGRLLALYHGTGFAGFTEFKTERGVWLTTSKRDADSYGGNWEGKIFDPNEKPEIRKTSGETYPVGEHMRFETKEDRDNFLKEYPDAESYLTERELRVKEAELDDDWEADDYDERSEELQELRKRSEKIERAYARYELKHSGSTTIGEMLEDPSLYSLNDFKRVWLSIDREVSFDDEFEYYDSDEEYRDAIAERLRNYIEEGADDQEWHDEMLNDFAVKARIPVGRKGEIFNNTNNRTYELYANVVNPYVFDNHGRGSEFNGSFYHTIEEAMADPQYDGVIVENARVGRYQDLGTVVLVKNPNQLKLTSNENPTENDDIRYSSKLQLRQKRDEDYSAAIRENDTETAARLVKEAAEAAGYTEDIYHGTGAFGFTKFDLGKMDDGASIFATTDRRVAESYSGETNRELISKRAGESVDAIIDRIDGAKDEDLLPLIKENIDPKYKRVPQERLAEMRDERVNDIRFYADKIMDFMDDNPGMFDEAKSIAASRLASSMYKLSRARSADEVDEYLRQYNDDVWELKFMDEDAFYEMFDGSSGIAATNNAIRELNTLLESDVMFTNGEKKPGSTLDVLTPGEARTRLIGEMSKGIYHLYGKNENMLEFDANGDNWNMIDTARISNKAFRIKSTSNKDKAWLSGLYMPYNDAQSLAARAARDANGEDDYLDVKDLRDPLGRISGWEFRSHKTGEMVMELESALPSRAMTRDIAKYAREVGYDGVIMRNLKDSGGATAYNQPSDVYIYFKPNAVKSADTVTYDDGGNAIPLSERFKTGEDDIRYSSKLDLRRKQERDNEYMDAVNTGDIAKAAKMVSKAAEEAGFKNAIPEQTLAYKVRTGKAPAKTKKVYKVFTVAPDGSPTALFVSGTQKLPQGVWLDAQDTWHFTAKNGKEYVPSTQNPYTEGGKTGGTVEIPNEEIRKELIERGFLPEGSKAKSVTALAYRPGWHAGDLPFFPQGGMQDKAYAEKETEYGDIWKQIRKEEGVSENKAKRLRRERYGTFDEWRGSENVTAHPYKNIHRYNQVVFECEIAFDHDYTRSEVIKKNGENKGKVQFFDMQEMPVDGGYKFATNPMANANDIGSWYISGSLKIGRALTQEECDAILKENGRVPQFWEQGEMDLESLGYDGQQYEAARKTLAPVTYDDDGNVIPLSKRFDPEVDDVRYSSKLDLPEAGPTFYSKLQREVQNFKGEKIGAASVESYLKGKGVKDEEIKWSGIRTFLEGKKSVGKEELLRFLNDNELQIDMRMLTENDTDYFEDGYYSADADEHFETLDQAREYAEQLAAQRYVNTDDVRMEEDYGEYTFVYTDEEGDEVTLLTVEEIDPYDREKPGADSTRWGDYKLDGGENYREVIFSIPGSSYTNQAMMTHWGPENPGVLAHARVQDFDSADGGKVLFVEEIQSDWHNAGQKYGYWSGTEEARNKRVNEIKEDANSVGLPLYEEKRQAELDRIVWKAEDALNKKGMRLGAFGDRKVKEALLENLTVFGFRQANDLTKLAAETLTDDERLFIETYKEDLAYQNVRLTEAENLERATPDAPFRNNYTDFVLKDLLRMAAEGDYDYLAWTTGKMQEERWSDEFAEGYRIEYDQQIPKFLKKYGKQWGAGLTSVELNTGKVDEDGNPRFDGRDIIKTVPAIVVNDAMKKSVLAEGQPMFSTKLKLDGKEIELTEREEKLMEQLNEGYLKRIEQVTVEKDAQIEKLKEQMKAAVGAEKQKAREQIAKIRKEKNDRIAYLEKQWRQNTNWHIAELKKKAEAKRGEEHDDMIRRLAKLQAEKDQKIEDILANHRRQRQEARDRRNDRKLRVKFQKLARKALRESQNKPGLASERVQELLKDIDLTALGMRDDTRTSLHNKLLEIMEMRKTDENYLALHAEQDWKKVERLFKKQIKDMSLEEVNDLITELSALCHYQETTDRLIKDEQNRTAAEVGRQIVKDLKELTPLDITNPVKVLSAKYLRDNLSPDRAFNRLSGYKRDSAMRSLYRQVLDGYTKVKEFEKKSDELFDGFRNDPKNKEFLKNGAKQTIPVTSKYGQTALISPAMRVSLYMASRNRDNLRHISTDGMTVPEPKAYAKGLIEDAYGRGTTIVLDPVDVNKVCANMTESEKEFAGLLETFFDGYAKEAINDTSVELDGILKAIVDHYFPIASDKNFLAKSMDSFQDPTLEGWNNLKTRQEGANNKILLEDARQVLQRHIRNTARYYGLAIPMRNWNKVYGYTSHRDEDTGTRNSVQSAIKNAWNSDTADYIERLIRDDINSGGRKAERGVMDSMRSAYAGTTLTLNAGVALKQTTSYFMAGSILDMESLMYGLSHKFKKTDQEYMDSITPWGWARRQGESTIELGEMARRRDPITRNTPNWNQAMDVLTTNALFTAAERSIQKDYPGLKRGDKKYDDALAERYNQVLWRTQPQYESAFRPEYLRKTDIGSRTFGMFKTESMQMSGELIDAWGQWKADEKRAKSGGEQEKRWKSESSKQFYKTFASWLASNMCFAMMGTALDIVMFHKGKPYRNKRGEVDWQTIAAKTGANFVGSALGGYFFAGTAFSLGSYLFNIISGEKATWYDIEVPGISLINDMVTNTGNWVGTMIDEEASPSAKAKATSKFVLSASKFTPLGFAGNLLKLADSLNLYIQDIREGIKTGDWHLYEAGDGFLQDTSPTKDQYANQAVYYAGQGNIERAGRALKKTKTGNLEKALGRKIGDVMFSRFVENPQDLVSYMETIAKNGGTPKLSDVPDRGFSSFTKLKEGLGSPNRNENWHHIVEQQQGPGDNNFGKFSSTQINNANNVISIPSGAGSVHKAITDYYTSVQDFTDGMTVREWLAENKTFEEQFDFGIEQLRKYGEVAPTERGWIFIPDEEKINAIPLKEGKDKELTATQKQWDTMMAEAREDGGLTDREIRAAALQMLNEGMPKDEVIELYKSKKNDKYIDEWMKYDGESGGDLSVYFGFMNAKSLGNQDGAAEYLNESGLPDDDKWALWELAGWSEASYDKKVE